MGVRLPAEYQEVEYLESTGEAQWIDVGFPITDTLSMELTFSAVQNKTAYYMGLYSGNTGDFYIYNARGYFQVVYGCSYSGITGNPVDTLKHTYYCAFEDGNTVIRENGEIIISAPKFDPLKTDRHIRIAGTSSYGQNKVRTYAYKAFNGVNKVADFIPCYRKSDDKPGMYDLVTETFLVNQGVGEDFTVGPDVIDSISPLMVAWRRIMMAAASVAKKLVKLIATSGTGLVSFDTNVEEPVKVTCEFSPVQEGTGDPSPDNVRPISGWTGCEIYKRGVNLFDYSTATTVAGKYLNDNGIETDHPYISYVSSLTPIIPGLTYWKSGGYHSSYGSRTYFWTKEKTFISSTNAWRSDGKITAPQNAYYVSFSYVTFSGRDMLSSLFFAIGDSSIPFEEYQGATLPITFTDPSTGDPLTVYDGTVTLNEDGSVDLVVNKLFDEFDGSSDENWKYEVTRNNYKNAYINIPTAEALQTNSSKLICSMSLVGASTNTAIRDHCYISQSKNFNFTWLDTLGLSSAAEFKAWLQDGHSIQIAATLAIPITYHFDNIGQLNSFLGTNNIWHNMNGQITVEYYNYQ